MQCGEGRRHGRQWYCEVFSAATVTLLQIIPGDVPDPNCAFKFVMLRRKADAFDLSNLHATFRVPNGRHKDAEVDASELFRGGPGVDTEWVFPPTSCQLAVPSHSVYAASYTIPFKKACDLTLQYCTFLSRGLQWLWRGTLHKATAAT